MDVASAVKEASANQDKEWGMMMDPAEIDVISAFLNPSTTMLEWSVRLLLRARMANAHPRQSPVCVQPGWLCCSAQQHGEGEAEGGELAP